MSSVPLWKRAIKDPKKAVDFLKKSSQKNLLETIDLIEDKVSSLMAIGYSSSGVVVEVGEGIDDINIGDRVACAGSNGAYHAEQIKVSRISLLKFQKMFHFKMLQQFL